MATNLICVFNEIRIYRDYFLPDANERDEDDAVAQPPEACAFEEEEAYPPPEAFEFAVACAFAKPEFIFVGPNGKGRPS